MLDTPPGLYSFSVQFQILSSEDTLSLVASNRLSGTHEDHLLPILDLIEMFLRTAVVHWSEGAGEPNSFKAPGQDRFPSGSMDHPVMVSGVTEEWLSRVVGGRQILLYERSTNEEGKVVVNVDGLIHLSPEVSALATGAESVQTTPGKIRRWRFRMERQLTKLPGRRTGAMPLRGRDGHGGRVTP